MAPRLHAEASSSSSVYGSEISRVTVSILAVSLDSEVCLWPG